MGLLNWLRKCIGIESDDHIERGTTSERSFLQIFRKKKYRSIPEEELNDTSENPLETNTNILEENDHHSEERQDLPEHVDHNENVEMQNTGHKDKAPIVDLSNVTIPIRTADECTVDSLYSEVFLTLANYKNMTKFLEPFDEYVSFELSAIRYPDVTIQDLLETLEYTPLNTHKSEMPQGNLKTLPTINPVQKTIAETSRAPNAKNKILPISSLTANTRPPGVRLPLKTNTGPPELKFPLAAKTGPPGVRWPLKTNTGPPGVRLPLKTNTGPPGVRLPVTTKTGPPGVRLPLKVNTGPPGVSLPLKTNTGPPGVRLPLKTNTVPPGVRLPVTTNTGPPGVRLPLKANTEAPGIRLPLKTNTGPPGVRLPLKANTGPKLGSTQNTKPPFPLPSTSSQVNLQNTKMTASKTDVEFECMSLTKVKDGGFIVNGKVNVPLRHWNCITGTKKHLRCEACKTEMVKSNLCNHIKAKIHIDNLKKCGVLADFGSHLIRKVDTDCVHCAICNTTMTKAAVQDHIVSVEHKNKYTNATETAEFELKRPEDLTTLDNFYTIKEKPTYLQIDSLLKVHGGFIINRATVLRTHSRNALTGPNSKRYCNVCQTHAVGKNGYMHMFGYEHKKNLKKYNYLLDYKEHLIRKLPNEQYHCGICDAVFAAPTAHIAQACHREGVVESSKKVAAILADPAKYTTVKL